MKVIPTVGDIAPIFICPSSNGNKNFEFATVAGRYVVLSFFGAAEGVEGKKVLSEVLGNSRNIFNDNKVSFFGVSNDAHDEEKQKMKLYYH